MDSYETFSEELKCVNSKLYWQIKRPGITTTKEAGGLHKDGHRRICLNRKRYLTHHVIWFLHYKKWPQGIIIHLNGNRTDNRLSNLKDVPAVESNRNMKLASDNTTGMTGITERKQRKLWTAHICTRKGKKLQKTFKKKEDAIKWRKEKEIEYKYHKNHGITEKKSYGN